MAAKKPSKRQSLAASRSKPPAAAPSAPAAPSAAATSSMPYAPPARKRVFIVDDHPVVRRGLVQMIDNEPDLIVCGQGEDAYAAIRAIREANPDIAIVDVSLPP